MGLFRVLQEEDPEERGAYEISLTIISLLVLFLLIFGFSSTIQYKSFTKSLKSPGIFIGVGVQMVVMPLVGFALTKTVDISDASTIVFLILLSSPGGALSNLLNSLFNGDLALSVAMTTVSTILSLVFLPLNLVLYLNIFSKSTSGEESITEKLDWGTLGITCSILVIGVVLGLTVNAKYPDYVICFYRIANICGILQIGLAFITSNNDTPLWEKPPEIFVITAGGALCALLLGLFVSLAVGLEKPSVFSVTIEVAVQNSAVAISFSFAAFSGKDLSESLAIPVVHGMASTLYCVIFAMLAFRAGWTYSPENATIWQSLVGFHQPQLEDDPKSEAADTSEKDKGKGGKPETDLEQDHGDDEVSEIGA